MTRTREPQRSTRRTSRDHLMIWSAKGTEEEANGTLTRAATVSAAKELPERHAGDARREEAAALKPITCRA